MNENSKIAILFNGPPRAGKDTASSALVDHIGSVAGSLKFTQPVKDGTHAELGLECAHDAYEDLKDMPLPEFKGMTPREAYIDWSRRKKAAEGEDAVARLFVAAMLAMRCDIVVNPDCGDDMEALAVAGSLDFDRVLVVRVHKDGHTFDGDCRTWVGDARLRTVDVVNLAGREDEFKAEVVGIVQAFLDDMPVRRHAA